MRKQLYMRRHSKNLVRTLNGARNSPNNADGLKPESERSYLWPTEEDERDEKTVLHNLNVYMNYAFDLLTRACLFEHRGPIPEPGRLQWDICFNYARQKSLTWQWIYQTFFSVSLSLLLFHVLCSCLGCEMTTIALRETAIACRCVVALCTRLQMNIWSAYWFHVWKWDPSE